MRKPFPILALWCLCEITFNPGAFSQTLADPLLEQQRLKELEQRTNTLGSFEEKAGPVDPGPAQAADGPCFPITQLTVDGVTAFPPETIASIVRKYVPKCMQGADIQAVMRELDSLYTHAGYITSKSYIPAQNLQTGTLILSVIEGHLEDVLLIDEEKQLEGRRADWLLNTAFPHVKQGLFQLRDFEQGLDQMNRLTSVEAVLQLQPGTQPGGSYAIVQRIQKDRFRGFTRLDNMGSESTGRQKLSLDGEVDDLFGLNDQWNFGYSGTLNTNALSLSNSIPYGYWTFGSNVSYSEYLTPLSEASEIFGTTNAMGLTAQKLIARDQFTTTELNFALNTRSSERFINDVRLTPQNLTTVEFGWRHMKLSEGARNSFDGTVMFGTPWLGADIDRKTAVADVPQAQFTKFSGGWQRQAALDTFGTLVNDLRLQYSPHVLYGAEQMALGSYATVRGFTESVAVGDSGAFMRNDLYLAPETWTKIFPSQWKEKLGSKVQPHIFMDLGVVFDAARHTQETAGGAGFGFSWYTKRVTVAGLVGIPLFYKDDQTNHKPIIQVRADLKTW